MLEVELTPAAEQERLRLPERERRAMQAAPMKLAVMGESLGFPHASGVRGIAGGLRELRPRAGRSTWRAFYRRVGDRLVVASIGPEAEVDRRGFERAVRSAVERLLLLAAEEDELE